MTLLAKLLERIAGDLTNAGASFALVGGLAVGIRTAPRFTTDIDLAIAVSNDKEAEDVIGYLIRYGYRPVAEIDHDLPGRLATMRLVEPGAQFDGSDSCPVADIICATCGIEREAVKSATQTRIFPKIVLPTAQIPHLIAMKVVAESDVRTQDRTDIIALIASASDEELVRVPHLLDLIINRGFSRGKDLHTVYQQFLVRR